MAQHPRPGSTKSLPYYPYSLSSSAPGLSPTVNSSLPAVYPTHPVSSGSPTSPTSGLPVYTPPPGVSMTSYPGPIYIPTTVNSGSVTSSSALSTSSTPSSTCMPSESVVTLPAACPVDDGMLIQDADGVYYRLSCDMDANPGSYSQTQAPSSFNDCFASCDAAAGCSGFSYYGPPGGLASGVCYLKTGTITFTNEDLNSISAFIEDEAALCSPAGTTSSLLSSSTLPPSSYAPPAVTTSSSSSTNPISDMPSVTTLSSSSSAPLLTYYETPFVTSPTSTSAIETGGTTSAGNSASTETSYADYSQCPYLDGTIYTDSQGEEYDIHCSSDSSAGLLDVVAAEGGGLQDCLDYCDANDECAALTYSGDDSQEYGNCYLKNSAGQISKTTNSDVQVAVKRDFTAPTTTTAVVTATYTPAYDTATPTPTRCLMNNYAATDDVDDGFCRLDLPFDMRIFNVTSRTIFPSSNGVRITHHPRPIFDRPAH